MGRKRKLPDEEDVDAHSSKASSQKGPLPKADHQLLISLQNAAKKSRFDESVHRKKLRRLSHGALTRLMGPLYNAKRKLVSEGKEAVLIDTWLDEAKKAKAAKNLKYAPPPLEDIGDDDDHVEEEEEGQLQSSDDPMERDRAIMLKEQEERALKSGRSLTSFFELLQENGVGTRALRVLVEGLQTLPGFTMKDLVNQWRSISTTS